MNRKIRLFIVPVVCALLIGGIIVRGKNVDMLENSAKWDTFLLFDLQDRLVDTIEEYDNVQEALVFIVPGEGEESDSMASIVVTTGSGRLTDEVAAGIRRTVNQAVENLSAENITIEDQDGNIYGEAE